MEEAHYSMYAMHLGNIKMYRMLKESYWQRGLKVDVAEFVSKCLTYQQVKAEHKHSIGLLQSLLILEWKWENMIIDFMIRLLKTQQGNDAVWVIVDRLTKSIYFLLVKVSYNLNTLAELYMKEIVRLHGASVSIVLYRDLRFTS